MNSMQSFPNAEDHLLEQATKIATSFKLLQNKKLMVLKKFLFHKNGLVFITMPHIIMDFNQSVIRDLITFNENPFSVSNILLHTSSKPNILNNLKHSFIAIRVYRAQINGLQNAICDPL